MSRNYVPVAQLDRVSDYESEGSGFEPLQAHQKRRYEVFYYTSLKGESPKAQTQSFLFIMKDL